MYTVYIAHGTIFLVELNSLALAMLSYTSLPSYNYKGMALLLKYNSLHSNSTTVSAPR